MTGSIKSLAISVVRRHGEFPNESQLANQCATEVTLPQNLTGIIITLGTLTDLIKELRAMFGKKVQPVKIQGGDNNPLSEDEALNLICDAREDEPTYPIKDLLKKLTR